jgi:hypothetical protein
MTEKRIVNLSSTVVRSDTVIASEIDGEVVMMNVEHGSYSWLDAIGSEIWDMLKSSRRVSEICEILMEHYDVEKKSCEEDVLAFLNALASKNIIAVGDCAE